MMKKLSVLLLMMMGAVAFAADVSISGTDGASIPVYQFTSDNVNLIKNPSQPNQPANSLTLSVKAGTSVYLSNMVDSWWKNGNEIEPLGMTYQERMASGNNIMRDYDRGYDMSAGKYGYMFVETGTIKPLDGIVHYGTGETVDIQYATGRSGINSYTNKYGELTYYDNAYLTTKGYYLGTFDKDADILLFMTTPTETGDFTVNSVSAINPSGKVSNSIYDWDYYNPSADPTTGIIGSPDDPGKLVLGSRQAFENDVAGNRRWNFGFRDYTVVDDNGNLVSINARSREFICLYGEAMDHEEGGTVTGQPLPGVLSSCLVALSAIVLRKRRSNKR